MRGQLLVSSLNAVQNGSGVAGSVLQDQWVDEVPQRLRLIEAGKCCRVHLDLTPGHKTSVSLEDEFWSALKEIARNEGITVFELADQDR